MANLQKFINKRNWDEVVFCGFGEPTERLDCLLAVTRWIRRYYGKPMTIRVDTNGQGYLINKQRDIIKEMKAAGVDKVSVSLNAHDGETYNKICRPSFLNAYQSILEFIERSKREIDTEVTVVDVPEIDIEKAREIAHRNGVRFRIRKYVPCFL